MTTAAMSKGFFEFVKSIGEAKSKQEEDRIIENELHVLKAKMAGRNVANRQMREYLIRMVYVEMLGHDASFGHIHGVKLTRARKLVDKRVGYMACSLCLHKDHELMLLLVGGLQTDLQSQNQLEVATALVVACKLINEDAIPALLPLVLKLLGHTEASIRKKAIMVVQRFYELNESCVSDVPEKAKRMLCDKDPSVMAASLHILFDLIDKDVNSYKDLVSSFVSILKQIIEHRLPKDYDYHRMPAPWAQIKLLQILALLGTADKSASEGMYEVLHEVMRRADIGINVGYAIIYECVRTVTIIFPNAHLLAEAAKCTSRFITSENHNLKYLGINALASIVQVQPQAANEHQMVVIDCLEDKDETLRRKTLDLLYRMTNEHNVNVICTKLIASLKDSVDVYLRQELIEKITSLAEKFAPDTIWFIETMSEVFELGAELVKPQFAHNFIRELAEGVQANVEDDESEEDIAQYAADFFFELLDKSRIPNILLKVIAWVLGEYGQYCTGHSVHDEDDSEEMKEAIVDTMEVVRRLWDVVEKQGEDSETRQWAMSATCKLCRHLDSVPPEVALIVDKYKTSVNSELQQLSHELIELTKDRPTMLKVYSKANITDSIRVDVKLKFLNKFVKKQLDNGARSYDPPSQEDNMYTSGSQHRPNHMKGLQLEHHIDDNVKSMIGQAPIQSNEKYPKVANTMGQDDEDADATEELGGGLNVRKGERRWGPAGYGGNGGNGGKPSGGAGGGADDLQADALGIATERSMNDNSGSVQKLDNGGGKVVREDTPPAQQQTTDYSKRREPERELTEKERLAKDLFNLGGGGSSTRRGKPRRKGAVKRKRRPAAKAHTSSAASAASAASAPAQADDVKEEINAQAQEEPDLLEFGTDNLVEVTQAPAQPSAADGGDLFDLLGGVMDAAPANTGMGQAATQAAPQVDPMLDLLGDLGSSQPVASSGTGLDMGDIFSGLGGGGNNNNGAAANGMGLLSNAAVARGFDAPNLKSIKGQLNTFAKSHDTDQLLASDSSLQVTYFKVYKQQQSSLCIFVSNLTSDTINNITVGTVSDNNANIHLSFDVTNSVPRPKPKNVHTAVIASLNPNETACQMISFGASNTYNLTLPTKLTVQVSHSGNYGNVNLTGAVDVGAKDLMRPYMMDTQRFGQMWLKLNAAETKFEKRGNITNVQDYVGLITNLQLYHIQTIQAECIAAGQIASLTNPQGAVPVLVHAKCVNGQFTILVRSGVPKISNAVAMDLNNAL